MPNSDRQVQHITRDSVSSDEVLVLPGPNSELMPGVTWGRHDCLFTPAYWAAQVFHHADELGRAPIRLGDTLVEEVAACLLGGHGAPAETGLAAFQAVRNAGLLDGDLPSEADILSVLSRPLVVRGRIVHYRFARRRSRYLSAAVSALRKTEIADDSHAKFRDDLTRIDGIGLKTASWITRNWLDSDAVAVLDIHVLRAGCIMGIFPAGADVRRDYKILESAFLNFAGAISVRASRLDALIWRQMKSAGQIGLRAAARALQRSTASNTLMQAA